ncbi:hypothetical protein [Rhodovulum sp. 12E13]|uniref:hypothetical protein n=1 Tax=Rhodovulum sp. 12E13 TaxID=2203891 RepID=UPI0018F5C494|nr:hypothetical protein [Rhodovulum sp. 12E13]
MTTRVRTALLLALLVASAACTRTETYPVSGRPCGPDDPVQDIRAGECIPPG